MKKLIFSLILLYAAIPFSAYAQEKENVVPIKPVITSNTKFVSVKKYAEIDPIISDGIIKISTSGALTYVDTTGTYIYGENAKLRAGGAGFDYTRGRFSFGVAMVKRDNMPNSIIYTDNKYVDLPDTYVRTSGFVDGIAMAEKKSGLTQKASCYINQEGKEVFPALSVVYSYYSGNLRAEPESEGMRAYFDPKESLWGYADGDGKIIIKPRFARVLPFADGLAAVCIKENYNERWGFVNPKGEMVIPATYAKYPGSFSEGLAVVRIEDSKAAYIDKTGKVVSPEFYECNKFKDGHAFVNLKYGETAVIDRDFKVIKKFDYNNSFAMPRNDSDHQLGAEFYNSTVAINRLNGPGAILNPKGEVVYEGGAHAAKLDNFYDGMHAMATIRLGSEIFTGFINPDGEFVILFIPERIVLTPPGTKYTPTSNEKAIEAPGVDQIADPKIEEPEPPKKGPGKYRPRKGKITETKKYTLTLHVQPKEVANLTGAGVYNERAMVTLSTMLKKDSTYKYSFVRWMDTHTKKEISDKEIFNLPMPSKDTHITAVYKENPKYELKLINPDAEILTLFGAGEYYATQPVLIEAKVKTGYRFNGWYKPGITGVSDLFAKAAVHTLIMPRTDLVLRARYAEKEEPWLPSVILSSTVEGVTLRGGGTYEPGSKFTISTTVPEGYRFSGWYTGRPGLQKENPFTDIIYNQSLFYQARFVKINGTPINPGTVTVIPNDKQKIVRLAGKYDIPLSSQSVVGYANAAKPLIVPATAYMEIHLEPDMPTLYTGDVMGVLYFDIDPVAIPADLKKEEKFMKQIKPMGGEFMSVYFSPLFIYRVTGQYIFAMGEGLAGVDKRASGMKEPSTVYRFEYSKGEDGSIVLGKYQIYEHSITRVDNLPKNKYEWVNPGIVKNPDATYLSEPDKENRYNGCTLYPADNDMPIPWVAKPQILELLDASLKHPDAMDLKMEDWTDFMMKFGYFEYATRYGELRNSEQVNTVTDSPIPGFK